ncbi:MAG: head decoration protein [Aestuariivirga sp.]|uniref:head decoration protein n=1 Tax=Aestuariivirga sp. TaxID=2650926 RepID=UPI0038CFA624
MTVLVETRHPGEFILSEANGHRSREAVTIASGAGIIAAGTVLGRITASGRYAASAVGASDGSQVPAAIAIHGADASAASATVSAIVRDAEVNGKCLTYHADRDQPAEKAAANAGLAILGVIVR